MPITGAITVGGAVVAVLFLVVAVLFYLGFQRNAQMQHEERLRMIEKGIAAPPKPLQGWPGVKQQEQQLRFEERRLMIEKGVPLPPDRVPSQPDDWLRSGLSMLCLGIGGAVAYVLLYDSPISEAPLVRAWLAVLAPVLTVYGIGCLAYYGILRKRATAGQAR